MLSDDTNYDQFETSPEAIEPKRPCFWPKRPCFFWPKCPVTICAMQAIILLVLESAMNSHIPTKIISKRNQTPWISRRIKRLHKRKQRAFNSYKQHRDLASYETFSKQRKSPILRLEMLIEVTFRPFVLTHRKDSGRTSKA